MRLLRSFCSLAMTFTDKTGSMNQTPTFQKQTGETPILRFIQISLQCLYVHNMNLYTLYHRKNNASIGQSANQDKTKIKKQTTDQKQLIYNIIRSGCSPNLSVHPRFVPFIPTYSKCFYLKTTAKPPVTSLNIGYYSVTNI